VTFGFPVDKLTQDLYNVATWHLLFLLAHWCFVLPPRGKVTSNWEMWIRLKCFLACNWENLQKEFFLQAQVFLTSSNSIPFPQHDPSTHKRLFHNLTLRHVREYFRVTYVLAPLFFAPTSSHTTLALTTLHLELNGYFSLFFEGYKPN
jgi:hypothetical protein